MSDQTFIVKCPHCKGWVYLGASMTIRELEPREVSRWKEAAP